MNTKQFNNLRIIKIYKYIFFLYIYMILVMTKYSKTYRCCISKNLLITTQTIIIVFHCMTTYFLWVVIFWRNMRWWCRWRTMLVLMYIQQIYNKERSKFRNAMKYGYDSYKTKWNRTSCSTTLSHCIMISFLLIFGSFSSVQRITQNRFLLIKKIVSLHLQRDKERHE